MDIAVGKAAIYEAAEKLSNWGRWGKDDQIGTLNHVGAGRDRRRRKARPQGQGLRHGHPAEPAGPAERPLRRALEPDPHHAGDRHRRRSPAGSTRPNKLRFSDDAINMPVQAATHWDSLGHIFLDDKMYNGHHARRVDGGGVHVLGIEHTRARMVGRGVLLDVARHKGVDWFEDGYGISNEELDATAKAQGVEVRKGDFVIVRTGQMERCLQEKKWGDYAGGPAPGVKFENCYWCQEKEIAGICSDTWGVEVRPNETTTCSSPGTGS